MKLHGRFAATSSNFLLVLAAYTNQKAKSFYLFIYFTIKFSSSINSQSREMIKALFLPQILTHVRQRKHEVLSVHGHVFSSEKQPGSLLEGFTKTQIRFLD
ncbi:hypothetical protein IGI04_024936 [Brassica rapa subsp. trilocularis]|uniref:Uncharacterized protein n=1 Tax=Brassica rapa subsp. trilocularis TaxID=1813537 RepID=A0ABQ7L388_BRACM|nr:hypothetical protein IGI04_028902 [Brassica rapa subsp. trilocularis]KAG5382418.1 hypothetical protein IGI04_033888 [Brassica rapa subsp. trilocularis]KAG5394973.1 hypothetical protein IGI04_024936 [Brassica rapa subsp. trilocularis]